MALEPVEFDEQSDVKQLTLILCKSCSIKYINVPK